MAVYKIVSIIKNERKDKKSLVTDVRRLKDKVKFMEMDLDWTKARGEYWEECSFKLQDLKSDVTLIKSKLEEENTEDK
ncbi:hypothetical protein PDK11_27145 [Bacillus cereus]|nr:hypothetical protein [Bacillus cereus]